MSEHSDEREFQLLESGLLTLERREQICEHLAECETCMQRYVNYLEQEEMLIPPPRGMADLILQGERERELRRRLRPNIALRALLAASLALALWWGGAFGGLMRLGDGIGYAASQVHGQLTQGYSELQRSRIDRQMENYHRQMEQYFNSKGATGNE